MLIYVLDFFRELFARYKKIILTVLAALAVILTIVITKVNVKADNAYKVDYSDKRFFNYTVEADDSLWSIAETNMDYDYYDSVYDYMNELKRMNHLTTDNLQPGQNLIITYYVNHNR